MLLGTLAAAGIAVVGTWMVISTGDRKAATPGTVPILALACTGNVATFERVVHSELDAGVFSVVVSDCQAPDPRDAWRRYRSLLQGGSGPGGPPGVVVDAYGLLALLMSLGEADGEKYLPRFIVAIAPADDEQPLVGTSMSCDPDPAKEAGPVDAVGGVAALMRGLVPERSALLRDAAVPAVVLQSLESPHAVPDVGKVMMVPSRGFLPFDRATVCAATMQQRGGYTEDEIRAARAARAAAYVPAPMAPGAAALYGREVVQDARDVYSAVVREHVQGRRYCGGYLRAAVDDLLRG